LRKRQTRILWKKKALKLEKKRSTGGSCFGQGKKLPGKYISGEESDRLTEGGDVVRRRSPQHTTTGPRKRQEGGEEGSLGEKRISNSLIEGPLLNKRSREKGRKLTKGGGRGEKSAVHNVETEI